jgi:hypothetical protein
LGKHAVRKTLVGGGLILKAAQKGPDARCPLMQRVRGSEGEKVGEAESMKLAAS